MTDARLPVRRVLLSIALAAHASPSGAETPLGGPADAWQARVILQTEDVTCLPAALANLLRFRFGLEVDQSRLVAEMLGGRSLSDIRAQGGFSLGDGLEVVAARALSAWGEGGLGLDELGARLPAILQTETEGGALHFVTVLAREGELFAVADPATGGSWMTAGALGARWTGIAFFVTEPPGL
ncbi:cysteine peptidase family C39 domain-containing protein [Roseicyclus sp.]|uniref:cysteine peptidase family C39 domain-containing protein n=1 Tax=Roseicyclus sp. TaxID=1914329 RepID=UPI003F9F98E4